MEGQSCDICQHVKAFKGCSQQKVANSEEEKDIKMSANWEVSVRFGNYLPYKQDRINHRIIDS